MSAPRAAESLEQRVEIETPEQVVFSYEIAGVGTRAAAAIVDYLLCVGPGVLLAVLVLSWRGRAASSSSEPLLAVVAVLVLAQFVALWGYHVLFEALNDGQTPGKRRYGLRVVQDGGFAVSFGSAAVRNIARAIDLQPGFTYVVGMISVGLSQSGKRLGDILAGTIVVRERMAYAATPPVPAAAAVAMPAMSTRLTEEEYTLLDRFVARREMFDAARRRALATQIAGRLGDRAEAQAAGESVEAALVRLHEQERQARAAGTAGRSDRGAQREANALVAAGMGRWRAFAERLRVAERRGLRALSEDEVSAFVADYRAVATDLARLSTAARDRPLDAQYFLSRLVAAGHNLLYRRRRDAAVAAGHYIGRIIPIEVRRSAPYILVAAAFLFGPAAIAYVATQHNPERARSFLPAEMVERAESAELKAQTGAGYVEIPEPYQPIAASSIIANNVQVTYGVFALGITAGVGTILMLLFNGVSLGGFAGLYASTGQGTQLLAFVAPHGVLELSAIAIAGGAGFLLAAALLLPGARTRREALVENARRAITLVACATLMLVVAGTIEGFISPRIWPLAWKLLVSGGTLCLLALYLASGGCGAEDPAETVTAPRAP